MSALSVAIGMLSGLARLFQRGQGGKPRAIDVASVVLDGLARSDAPSGLRLAGSPDAPLPVSPGPIRNVSQISASSEAPKRDKPPLATALTATDYARAAKALSTDERTIRAVAKVESASAPFLADGRPVILYEAHLFHRLTAGRYAEATDKRGTPISVPVWDKSLYGPSGTHQWDRMRAAERLDRDAAWQACSWGMFQILGSNHRATGHLTVEGFVQAMESGAGAHLDAFVAFVLASPVMAKALRNHDWATFARLYNGPAYAKNRYDTKLAEAWKALA